MRDPGSSADPRALAPPEGHSVRPPSAEDLANVAALVRASDLADFGEPDYPEEELRADWKQLDLSADARLVLTSTGATVGYVSVSRRGPLRLDAEGFVHPEHAGNGVGTYLVRLAEARAREQASLSPGGSRVALNNNINGRNEAAIRLLRREGYEAARHFWRMSVEFHEPPPRPSWPQGVSVRACRNGDDERTVFAVTDEAFEDHWGHSTTTFEDWEGRKKRASFDPDLWFLVLVGGEAVCAAVCEERTGEGWVEELAVRRRWRRRGLGLALLRHVFGEFCRRGTRKVALGVDSQNLTGATRLYERAGMREDRLYSMYRKELQGG